MFEGVGKIPVEYKTKLKENYKPSSSNCKRTPNKISEILKETSKVVESIEIVVKVNKPTEWVS